MSDRPDLSEKLRPHEGCAVGNECIVGSFWRGSRDAFRKIACDHQDADALLRKDLDEAIALLREIYDDNELGPFMIGTSERLEALFKRFPK